MNAFRRRKEKHSTDVLHFITSDSFTSAEFSCSCTSSGDVFSQIETSFTTVLFLSASRIVYGINNHPVTDLDICQRLLVIPAYSIRITFRGLAVAAAAAHDNAHVCMVLKGGFFREHLPGSKVCFCYITTICFYDFANLL